MFFSSMIGLVLILDILFSILDKNNSRVLIDLILILIIFAIVFIFKKLGKIKSEEKFDWTIKQFN